MSIGTTKRGPAQDVSIAAAGQPPTGQHAVRATTDAPKQIQRASTVQAVAESVLFPSLKCEGRLIVLFCTALKVSTLVECISGERTANSGASRGASSTDQCRRANRTDADRQRQHESWWDEWEATMFGYGIVGTLVILVLLVWLLR